MGGAEGEAAEPRRQVTLTSAATIRPRRVRWLWDGRIALGTLALLAGREGVGKSTAAYWLAARVSRGELPGEHAGQVRSVLVCATEDSWAHTIVPRLIAADADLTRIYRVEVVADTVHVGLSLPRDIAEVERAAGEVNAGLLLLDPLMSRLDASLDSHRDHEVRLALEPLSALADRAGLAVLGLIHHNKSGSADPLQAVMGSRAFSAVARSVHTVVPDPDEESRRLFGTPKNNLGRTDLPTLSFTVTGHPIETDDGTAWTGRIVWGEDSAVSISDAMRRAGLYERDDQEDRDAAEEWLSDYLTSQGGTSDSAAIKKAAKVAGHAERALRRARAKLRLVIDAQGFPRVTFWSLPDALPSRDVSRDADPRGDVTTDMTDTTGSEFPSRDSHDSRDAAPRAGATTASGSCDVCGTELSTLVQQSRGLCNRCHVVAIAETKRGAA